MSNLRLLGQDPHFSYFQGLPMQLNPAMTGVFDFGFKDQNIRFATLHRQQWRSIQSPYVSYATPFQTTGASVDGSWSLPSLQRWGYMSGGLQFLTDQSGDLNMKNQTWAAALAFHFMMNHNRKEFFTLGTQFGNTRSSLDPSQAAFDNQWNGRAYDPNLPTGEQFLSTQHQFWDWSLGAAYSSFANKKLKIHAGLAFQHVNRPYQSSILSNADILQIPMKGVFHAQVQFPMQRNIDVLPQFIYARQAQANELNASCFFKFYPSQAQISYQLGAGYRFVGSNYNWAASDALTAGIGFRYNGILTMFQYDANLSSLRGATNTLGAFEISLTYYDFWGRERKRKLKGKYIKNINECPENIPFEEIGH